MPRGPGVGSVGQFNRGHDGEIIGRIIVKRSIPKTVYIGVANAFEEHVELCIFAVCALILGLFRLQLKANCSFLVLIAPNGRNGRSIIGTDLNVAARGEGEGLRARAVVCHRVGNGDNVALILDLHINGDVELGRVNVKSAACLIAR